MRFRFLLSEIAIGLRRNLTMTFAMVLTVALSLALLGVGLIVHKQSSDMKGYWYDKIEVSIFLKNGITDAQRAAVGSALQTDPLVAKVYYEDKAQAFARFQQEFRDEPDLAKNTLPGSLPESYRVKLRDPHQVGALVAAYDPTLHPNAHPGVDYVQDQKALLAPLFHILDDLRWVALIAAIAALLIALALISNTVRLAAFNRRRETGIMRLVGASTTYIQLPFLLEGVVAGVLGAGLACGVVVAVKSFVIDGLLSGTGGVGSIFGRQVEWSEIVVIMLWLLLTGVVMTSLASFLSLRRFLRV